MILVVVAQVDLHKNKIKIGVMLWL